MRIGVLALQGAFAEHIAVLRQLDVEAVEIRLPEQLDGIDGLIIPGGESTSITNLMDIYQLTGKIGKIAKNGFPILGTCAGMIILANDVPNGKIEPVGAMAIKVQRNAFGRQVDSFETELEIPVLGKKPFHAIFIRAPFIESVGKNVEVVARLTDGKIVAARQSNLLACSFHPELTDDTRFHKYFLEIVSAS
jgi:pyridoxal 5'-phosphate synthase pdxT subunit